MKHLIILVIGAALFVNLGMLIKAPDLENNLEQETKKRAKFEPEDGKVLVFAGQDLASIGGLDQYKEGYSDYFPTPGGVTLYTSIGDNDDSTGTESGSGLQGVFNTVDAGNGPSNMSLLMSDKRYRNSVLAIGLSLVNSEVKVANGELDKNIESLGTFLKSLGQRHVFLRIGYEFDGHLWNHYDITAYKKAYKRIVDLLNAQGITNTAYVWQSVGWVSNWEQLEEWYPGDDYVDWCAYSFFDRFKEAIMIDFAREKGKPVFIAEASPTISDHTAKFDGDTKETILSNPEQAQEAWEKWFVPFFTTIEENSDVVKAIHYINCNWKERPMWFTNKTFKDIDARLQLSPMISEKWKMKMNDDRYLNASDNLFKTLIEND
ncbi:glycosyl hydrolase [Spongiimicrobium sp. 3-5]|uniref:glycosyl hydrolase n=1 Tax=Spongiimicrobium sp. 3-5 TaxID=3332596 RepID=UPI00397FD1DD